MSHVTVETYLSTPLRQNETFTVALPAGVSNLDIAEIGNKLFSAAVQNIYNLVYGSTFVVSDDGVTVTYTGATTIPAFTRLIVEIALALATGTGDITSDIESVIRSVQSDQRQWRAEWFGLIDHATMDQVGVLNNIMDAYDPDDGPVEVSFPPYRIALNNGASNVPWVINKDGVSLKLHRNTRFIKTVAGRTLIRVGNPTALSEGDRVQGFSITGPGTFDGGSLVDASDNFPMLWIQYVQDGLVDGVFFKDAGDCLRFGDGSLAWSTENERSLQMRVKNCTFTNFRWFGCEMFGADKLTVEDNFYVGGALNDYTDNIPIRIVKCRDATVINNKISATGRGICTSTDNDKPIEQLVIVNNTIRDITVGNAISTSNPTENLIVQGNIVDGTGDGVGLGPSSGQVNATIFGPTTYALITGNLIRANSAECTGLIRFDSLASGKISNNMFYNLSNGSSGTKYVARFVDTEGLVEFSNNLCHWDYSLGVQESSGETGLQLICKNNVMKGPLVESSASVAFFQASSSGTLIKADNILLNS